MSIWEHVFNLGFIITFVLIGFYGKQLIDRKVKEKELKLRTNLIAVIIDKVIRSYKVSSTSEKTLSDLSRVAIKYLQKLSTKKLLYYSDTAFCYVYLNGEFYFYGS